MDVLPPECLTKPMVTIDKAMMGPGPSNYPQRVRDALCRQVMGHLHPETLAIMDEIKEGCRYVFQTNNRVTLCMSASGHGGMEASLCNLIDDGDVVLIGVTGIWGMRAAEMARRYGAVVHTIDAKLGGTISLETIEENLKKYKPVLLFLTQGESSTGVLQPIEGAGDLCRKYDSLLIVDTVASLGGTPFYADKWKVDVVYTGSQKVLGAPPGITPISFSPRAMDKVANRKTRIPVYYFDINMLSDYWDCSGRPRIYHHTISATLLYGLREALAMACEEGLSSLIERHTKCSKRLVEGLQSMGLKMFVERPEDRLPTVNAIHVPEGVDWKKTSDYAMKNHRVELSGGLGPTVGKVFRVGLMGVNASNERVDLILRVLAEALENASK